MPASPDFMKDLAGRLANRVQFTTNSHEAYLEAVEAAFGADVDYAQLVTIYGPVPVQGAGAQVQPGELLPCEDQRRRR